jgi:hypothetical protein
MTYSNLKEVFQSGKFLVNMEEFLNTFDAVHHFNHNKFPYTYEHLCTNDCMFGCLEDLEEKYYRDGKCLFTKNDLEWYFIPHACDTYVLFVWKYLQYVFPYSLISIVYANDHFFCVDFNKSIIYDMLEGLNKIRNKDEDLNKIQKSINSGKYYIIEPLVVDLCIKNNILDLPYLCEIEEYINDKHLVNIDVIKRSHEIKMDRLHA